MFQMEGSQLSTETEEEENLATVDDEYAVQYFGFHPQEFMNGSMSLVTLSYYKCHFNS